MSNFKNSKQSVSGWFAILFLMFFVFPIFPFSMILGLCIVDAQQDRIAYLKLNEIIS